MSWKQDLRKLDACYDRGDLADLLGASQAKVTGALTGTRTPGPKLKRRIVAEMERMRSDHTVGHEVAVYALQLAYQLRDADTRERRDEILEAHGLPEWTRNTITDRDALTEELAQIRETGLAFDDEERVEGVRCVAAPVLDDAERPYGALTISASTRTLRGNAFREEYPELVSDTATSIQLQATYS